MKAHPTQRIRNLKAIDLSEIFDLFFTQQENALIDLFREQRIHELLYLRDINPKKGQKVGTVYRVHGD